MHPLEHAQVAVALDWVLDDQSARACTHYLRTVDRTEVAVRAEVEHISLVDYDVVAAAAAAAADADQVAYRLETAEILFEFAAAEPDGMDRSLKRHDLQLRAAAVARGADDPHLALAGCTQYAKVDAAATGLLSAGQAPLPHYSDVEVAVRWTVEPPAKSCMQVALAQVAPDQACSSRQAAEHRSSHAPAEAPVVSVD